MIEELGVVGEHAPAGGAGHHLLLGVAAEVLTELRAAFEGAGTAWEEGPVKPQTQTPYSRFWYPQVSPASSQPCPAGPVPSLAAPAP